MTGPMGRRRQSRLDLPPRMQMKHGAYYYVTNSPRKWVRLSDDLAKARVLWAEIENQGFDTTPLIIDLIDQWLASPAAEKLAANTIRNYGVAARQMREFFKGARIGDVTPPVVASWLDNHHSPAVANAGRSLLSNVFKVSIRHGLCISNPCNDIPALKTPERKRYITDEEYIAIWNAANPVLRVAMDLSYLTTARISDVSRIMLKDITDKKIAIVAKKTGKPQDIAITPVLQEAIDAAKAFPRSVRGMSLICNRQGQPYHPGSFDKWWSKACSAANVADAVFHDIRAKGATDAKMLGMDYQKLLGHTSAAMSNRYIRIREIDQVTPLPKAIRK